MNGSDVVEMLLSGDTNEDQKTAVVERFVQLPGIPPEIVEQLRGLASGDLRTGEPGLASKIDALMLIHGDEPNATKGHGVPSQTRSLSEGNQSTVQAGRDVKFRNGIFAGGNVHVDRRQRVVIGSVVSLAALLGLIALIVPRAEKEDGPEIAAQFIRAEARGDYSGACGMTNVGAASDCPTITARNQIDESWSDQERSGDLHMVWNSQQTGVCSDSTTDNGFRSVEDSDGCPESSREIIRVIQIDSKWKVVLG